MRTEEPSSDCAEKEKQNYHLYYLVGCYRQGYGIWQLCNLVGIDAAIGPLPNLRFALCEFTMAATGSSASHFSRFDSFRRL